MRTLLRYIPKQLNLMFLLTLAAQAVGLVKVTLVARTFGASSDYDAFIISSTVASTLFTFLSSGLGVVMVPAFVQKQRAAAINAFLTAVYALGIVVAVVLLCTKDLLLAAAPKASNELVAHISALLAVVLLTQLITVSAAVATAYLQCQERFAFTKIASLAGSLFLLTAIICNPHLAILDFALYSLIGALITASAQFVLAIRLGYRFRPNLKWRREGVFGQFKVLLPSVLGSSLYQISILVDTLLATSLGEGFPSLLYYGTTVYFVGANLITANIGTYSYPKIAAAWVNDRTDVVRIINQAITLASLLAGGMLGLYLTAGHAALSIALSTGALSGAEVSTIYFLALILLAVLPTVTMRDLLSRCFYAAGNTRTPFINGLWATALNFTVSIVAAQMIGIYGIVLGTALSGVFAMFTLLARLTRKYDFTADAFLRMCGRMLLIMLACAGAALGSSAILSWCGVHNPIASSLLFLLLAAVCALLAYRFSRAQAAGR